MNVEKSDTDPRKAEMAAEQAHREYLASRLEQIDDPDERVNEIIDQHVKNLDPEGCTDEDRAQALGPNWRQVITFIQQAASLPREQAERIASHSMQEWDLDYLIEEAEQAMEGDWSDAYYLALDAGDVAMEPTYRSSDIYWETRNAYLAALMATVEGGRLSEDLRARMMRVWNTQRHFNPLAP